MAFSATTLIRKKRFGGRHTHEELAFLIQGYAQDRIPDYQMAAWLMAICHQGMTAEETAWLTQEMRDSGKVLDLSTAGVTVDKHSTGGIGDKTSLILAPLVASAGVPVPMMAGRGLAHTGGTLDKLESIHGFDVGLTFNRFTQQLSTVGAAIIGQTTEICPADRKLYALRDVTGTVDSLPLICGSIMSKKLAEGMSALVLDVKCGSGAFMKTREEARILAGALIDIGRRSGKQVVALITRMNEPLGRFVGNALEVRECLDIMEGRRAPEPGKGYDDTIELTLTLASHMIFLGGKAPSLPEARARAASLLADGSALRKFRELCERQGGDWRSPLPSANHTAMVSAVSGGYLNYTNLEGMGLAAGTLGAGRRQHSDRVDPAVGFEVLRSHGEPVNAGDPLFVVHYNNKSLLEESLSLLSNSYEVAAAPPQFEPLVLEVIV